MRGRGPGDTASAQYRDELWHRESEGLAVRPCSALLVRKPRAWTVLRVFRPQDVRNAHLIGGRQRSVAVAATVGRRRRVGRVLLGEVVDTSVRTCAFVSQPVCAFTR